MATNKLVSNLALLAISVVLSLGAAEVLLRGYRKMQARYGTENANAKAQGWIRERSQDAFDGDEEFYGKWDTFAKMRFSAYLGYWPAAHVEGNGYQTNDHGFRNDDDLPVTKGADEVRVFVVGGSTSWGAGVRQEDTYAAFMQKKLQSALPNKKVGVWIAGVGAYLSTHERITVVNKVARLEPDAVVHLTGWNDTYAGYRGYSVMDDTWDYTSAAAVLGQYHRLFVYDEDTSRMMDPGPPKREQHALDLFFVLDQLYYAQRLESGRKPHQAVVEDFVTNLRIGKASVDPKVAYLCALQPTIYATGKTLTEWEQAVRQKNESATPAYGAYNAAVYALYRAQLADRMKDLGIDYLDLDPAIASEARSVFTDHVHFGDRGNRLMGEALADALLPSLR